MNLWNVIEQNVCIINFERENLPKKNSSADLLIFYKKKLFFTHLDI